MLKWFVPVMFICAELHAQAGGAAPPAAAKGDAAAELKAHCAKLAELKNYSFESAFQNDAPAPGGGARDETPIAGKVEIGGLSELKRGDTVAYRKGEKLAAKKKDAWELWKASDPPAGGGGKGGRYGGGGGAGGSDAKERLVLRSLATLALPHEMLATFDAQVHDVKSAEADGKVTFTGTLTDSAAMEWSGASELNAAAQKGAAGGQKGGGGGGANGGGAFKATGTATVVFGKNGSPERVVVETQTKNKSNDYKQKRTITLRDCGATKFTAPKEAATALGG